MASYDPPQPLWKRNLAGVLDFLLALLCFGYVLNKLFGHEPAPPVINATVKTTELVGLNGWAALITLVLIVAYFVGMGRTGGTIFQRLFGMKRSSRSVNSTNL